MPTASPCRQMALTWLATLHRPRRLAPNRQWKTMEQLKEQECSLMSRPSRNHISHDSHNDSRQRGRMLSFLSLLSLLIRDLRYFSSAALNSTASASVVIASTSVVSRGDKTSFFLFFSFLLFFLRGLTPANSPQKNTKTAETQKD